MFLFSGLSGTEVHLSIRVLQGMPSTRRTFLGAFLHPELVLLGGCLGMAGGCSCCTPGLLLRCSCGSIPGLAYAGAAWGALGVVQAQLPGAESLASRNVLGKIRVILLQLLCLLSS